MKKVLSVVMALMFVASLGLTACSTPSSSTPADNKPASTPADTPADTADSTPEAGGGDTGNNNDDLVGKEIGPDLGNGPVGFDLDTLVERMGPENVANLKLGVPMTSLAGGWLNEYSKAVEALGKQYGFETIVLSADDDPAKAIDDLNSLKNQQVDAMVSYPCNPLSMATTFNEMDDAGVPQILCLDPGPDVHVTGYLTKDELKVGAAICDQFAKDLDGEEGYVLTIEHMLSDQSLMNRIIGFVDRAEEAYPNIHIVSQVKSDSDDGFLNVAKEAMLANEEINCIVGSYLNPLLSGVTAAQELGRTVYAYGNDCDEASMQMIKEGKITGLKMELWTYHAALTVFYALRAINGDTFDPEIPQSDYYGYGFVTAENVDRMLSVFYPDKYSAPA